MYKQSIRLTNVSYTFNTFKLKHLPDARPAAKIRAPLIAAHTLNATGQYRATLSLP